MPSPAFLARTAPLALLQEILSYSQSRRDVLSFALTCRHMREAWQFNNAGHQTAWGLIVSHVPAAEQALIAHRASQAVQEAEQQTGMPPKPLELTRMSSQECRVEASDILAVQQLEKLAFALEKVFSVSRYALPEDVDDLGTPETSERMGEWRAGMHKAIYRSIITGAALAGIYKEPYMEAASNDDLSGSSEDDDVWARRNQFLDGFPALSWSMTDGEQEEAFASYGEWLLNELRADTASHKAMEDRFTTGTGRAASCRAREEEEDGHVDCPVRLVAGGSHAEAHSVALEVMRLLWTSRQVLAALFQGKALWITAGERGDQNAQATVSTSSIVPYGRFSSWIVGLVKVEASDFGAVTISDLVLPAGVGSEVEDNSWIAERLAGDGSTGGCGIAPMPEDDENYPPLPGAQFFVFFLRKHMNLAFHGQFFCPDEGRHINNNWQAFSESLLIFSLDDVEGRESFYPEYASLECFPENGFLDGGDLLVSCNSSQAHAM